MKYIYIGTEDDLKGIISLLLELNCDDAALKVATNVTSYENYQKKLREDLAESERLEEDFQPKVDDKFHESVLNALEILLGNENL